MNIGTATHCVLNREHTWIDRPSGLTRRLHKLQERSAPGMRPDSPAEVCGILPQWQTRAKWCIGALVLVLPGSFVVLGLLWLYRRWV
jgi:hypothetical protein